MQNLPQLPQANRFRLGVQREALMTWIDHKPFLWPQVSAGKVESFLQGWR